MKIGLFTFNTEYMIRVDRLALAIEERNFESLWVPEHTHIPVPKQEEPSDPETGMPLSPADFFLPEQYRHIQDPFSTLGAAAAVTERIKLGTCVCLPNQHHPINLAKHLSTLDQLSEGRIIFGVGAGWNVTEMNHHGVEHRTRWRELRERLAALQKICKQDVGEFRANFIEIGPLWQFPKPLQPNGPKIVYGTMDTPFGREQVAKYADGWLPLTFDIKETKVSIEKVRTRMIDLGRDPNLLEISLFFLNEKFPSEGEIDTARQTGADRIIFSLPLAQEAEMIETLDRYTMYL